MCVCVCACVRMCVCVCVCAYVSVRKEPSIQLNFVRSAYEVRTKCVRSAHEVATNCNPGTPKPCYRVQLPFRSPFVRSSYEVRTKFVRSWCKLQPHHPATSTLHPCDLVFSAAHLFSVRCAAAEDRAATYIERRGAGGGCHTPPVPHICTALETYHAPCTRPV